MLRKINVIRKSILIPKCISKIKNWNVPLSFYFGVNNEEQIIFLKDGTKCFIRNKSDAVAFLENFILEANTSHEIFQIQRNDIVVDIGAHVGYFTLFAAKRASEGKVIAFEPSNNSFSLLEKNIKINNYKNVILEEIAIAKIKGKQILYLDKENEISNTIYKQKESLSKKEINTITLQDIFEKHRLEKIDFLKMDCEGAEYEIIMNAPSSILNKIQKISTEIHEEMVPYTKEVMIESLKKHGFNVKLKRSISGIKMELPLLLAWK